MQVPITFEYKGKEYSGYFSNGPGTGTHFYGHWKLMIDNYYCGQLNYSQTSRDWTFTSNSGEFEELSDWFEFYMVSWFSGEDVTDIDVGSTRKIL